MTRAVDSGSVVAFRVGFGLVMFAAIVRSFVHGWIRTDFIAPKHFFHYAGLGWVKPWPGEWMYVHFAVMAIAALGIAFGLAYRASCLVFALAFTYAHACDKAHYLNHYYLVSLLAFVMTLLPLASGKAQVRAWVLWLLRFQVGLVYVFGGIGKLGSDWLSYGEPLRIWLRANSELPIIGRFAHAPWFSLAFSWSGMLFDLCIVPLLLWRRSRMLAYIAVLTFHALTSVLFQIGMFPFIMIAAATLFFDPAWPRRWLRWRVAPGVAGDELRTRGVIALALYALFHVVFPLRSVLYPGNTLWTEEGFRFAWKVMLIDKIGDLELSIVDGAGRRTTVSPREYLTPFQTRMASTQPDMILELAHLVARDFTARGSGPVQVFADVEVSFNGRPRARLVDPTVDLTRIEDSWRPSTFVLPAPTGAPEF